MNRNVTIHCTLVVRNIVMVGCAEPWFMRAWRSSFHADPLVRDLKISALVNSHPIDPLRAFSEECRAELQALQDLRAHARV